MQSLALSEQCYCRTVTKCDINIEARYRNVLTVNILDSSDYCIHLRLHHLLETLQDVGLVLIG